MTPQERDVIAGIFDRLRQAENQPREPEAERFIAERLREQPYAPYAMAQAIYVQETALANMQAQIEELQAQVRQLEERPAPAAAPAQSGGFLSGIFGGGQPEAARPRSVPSFPQRDAQPASPVWNTRRPDAGPASQAQAVGPAGQQPSPWSNQAAQPPGRAGGGFMATALTTAAGVAGGMMLGNVLSNAFGGGQKSGDETAKASEANATETNAGTDNTAQAQTASDNTNYDDGSSNEANYQQASHDDGYDDGSSFGGDDDWA